MSNPIRIAHITDTHLGYRALNKLDPETGRNARTVDFERAFEWAIDDILARYENREIDGIIHAGDVFHQSRPTWQSLRHFIQQMKRIEAVGIPTLVIAGNHDTPRVRTGGSAYSVIELALPTITFYAGYEDKHDYETFQDFNLHVQAIPHGALTSDDPPVPSTVQGKINVMVIHGMVKGILKPGQHTEPGEEELDTSLLDNAFDYIALGHYHLHMQPPAIANGWYAGSTERNGWGDREATPGYVIVTLNGPGEGFEKVHIPFDDARPMLQPDKPIYADNKRGREIADEVIEKVNALGDEKTLQRAMVRTRILHAERGDKREAESILKRELKDVVWNISFAADIPAFLQSPSKPEVAREFPDLRELFAEFVTSRTGTGFNERFAKLFAEQGDKALERALADSTNVKPEEDAVS